MRCFFKLKTLKCAYKNEMNRSIKLTQCINQTVNYHTECIHLSQHMVIVCLYCFTCSWEKQVYLHARMKVGCLVLQQ